MENTRLGLTFAEVAQSRETHGENRFTERKRESVFKTFLRAFCDPMIVILLVALAVDLFFALRSGEWWEPCGIAAAVLISVGISTLSESKSSRAFERLRAEADQARCRVRRDGKVLELAASKLVVGDLVLLCAGDRLCADGKLVFGSLSADQSALNGESGKAHKYPAPYQRDLSCPAALFSGSFVSGGEGEMEVLRVGDQTMYGALALSLQEKVRGKSPLQGKLARLAKAIALFGYAAALLIALADLTFSLLEPGLGLIGGIRFFCSRPQLAAQALLHAVTLGVTVIVVAVPEGLPMMITVVLSRQMRRLLEQGVLVRKLSGIETCGAMDLLFCDKTGTLTEGRHAVTAVLGADAQTAVRLQNEERLAMHIYCNNQAYLTKGRVFGSNATDRALLESAFSAGIRDPQIPVTRRIPFDSTQKYAAAEAGGEALIKGAPERVLAFCAIPEAQKRLLLSRLSALSGGARALAFAACRKSLSDALENRAFLPEYFVLLSDPIRAETPATVRTLQEAGVQVVLLTGDAKETALAVAKASGILQRKEDRVLSGREIRALDDQKLAALLSDLRVVYRCEPGDKSRLARLARKTGRVCGMTGDGVNDAPALKLSNVGFSMGSGTSLAKDASGIVLLDDKLSAIPTAVLYGRTVYRSIRKFLIFQLSMNFCAVLISFLGPAFLDCESPITVLQMLWVNLIMDTLASLAFAGEAPAPSDLRKKPIKTSAPIVDPGSFGRILFGTLFSVGLCAAFLTFTAVRAFYGPSETAFLSGFFVLFIFCGVFNAYNVRSDSLVLWHRLSANRTFIRITALIALIQIGLVYFGGALFRCVPLSFSRLIFPILCASLILPADLLRKSLTRRRLPET